MPLSNSKGAAQKAATLARVRENQRRCRTRRRERMAELERKLLDYEAGRDPLEGNVSEKMKQLERENQRLRALLEASGLPRIWMDVFLRIVNENGTQSGPFTPQENLSGHMTRSRSTSEDVMLQPSSMKPTKISAIQNNPYDANTSTGVEPDFDLLDWTNMPHDLVFSQAVNDFEEPSFEAAAFPVALEAQITAEFPGGSCCSENSNCPNSGNSDGDTTLCSVAFELVRKCNSRRLDMVEIYVRLWSGFRVGKKGREDCSVNNKVLFGVLDHISG